jgi:hypothetical protein
MSYYSKQVSSQQFVNAFVLGLLKMEWCCMLLSCMAILVSDKLGVYASLCIRDTLLQEEIILCKEQHDFG